ncbi:hypothetical protein PSV08DRAFT_181106, partial [Bipolaris maydis]|uniref:uncharacterized protein n=1 Tax=Cochliobolus heterostrophus TaxID=5016 RepID=UPI0024DB0586
YPTAVWQNLWARYNKPVFRHSNNTKEIFPTMLLLIQKLNGPIIFNTSFLEIREAKVLGATFVFP